MGVCKHPIAHSWIRYTLVPFLLFAFASSHRYPADASIKVQTTIDLCLTKLDHDDPSDSDDLKFDRVFMAIMHKHKHPAPDLEPIIHHLEPLAEYLIRRAQLKGPFELLERTDIGSAAWVQHERSTLQEHMSRPAPAWHELCAPVRPTAVAHKPKPLPAERCIDPRLVHAQPGQYIAANTPTQLSIDEDGYYRRQNYELEQFRLLDQQRKMHSPAIPVQATFPPYNLYSGCPADFGQGYGPPYMQSPLLAHLSMQQSGPRKDKFSWHGTAPPCNHLQAPSFPTPTTSSGTFPHTTMAQPYTNERRQPAQPFPIVQHSGQYQPVHPQTTYHPDLYHPTQTPNYRQPPPQPPSTIPHSPLPVPSADFAHLRGKDWSVAAQQRAGEIAAKVSAYERDVLAHDIMMRAREAASSASVSRLRNSHSVGSLARMEALASPARPESTRMGGGGVHVVNGDDVGVLERDRRSADGARAVYSTLGAPGISPAGLRAVALPGRAVRQVESAGPATTPASLSLQDQLWVAARLNNERLGCEDVEMERKGL